MPIPVYARLGQDRASRRPNIVAYLTCHGESVTSARRKLGGCFTSPQRLLYLKYRMCLLPKGEFHAEASITLYSSRSP